jgi:membrane protein
MRAAAEFVRAVIGKWLADDALAQGAALAFYMLFSLTPLLVLVIAMAGLALGNDAVHARVLAEITHAVGPDAAASVDGMIAQWRSPTAGIVASILSIATMLLGASGVFGHLQSVLNRMFDAPTMAFALRRMATRRLATFAVVLGIGLLLVATMLLTMVLDAFRDRLAMQLPVVAPALPWLDVGLSVALATLAFAVLFLALPDVRLPWRYVLAGGLATALLFAVGKVLIGIYLARSGGTSVFGDAASLVLLLLWIYYSAQILFLGAEVTAVLARRQER